MLLQWFCCQGKRACVLVVWPCVDPLHAVLTCTCKRMGLHRSAAGTLPGSGARQQAGQRALNSKANEVNATSAILVNMYARVRSRAVSSRLHGGNLTLAWPLERHPHTRGRLPRSLSNSYCFQQSCIVAQACLRCEVHEASPEGAYTEDHP